jgi:hypothetical protein
MDKRLKIEEFLFFVETGELDRMEILAYIDLVTDHYKSDRLNALLEEVDYYVFNRRIEIRDGHQDQIIELVKQYQQQGKELPVKIFKFPNGKEATILDEDKLLGGAITWDLYPLFELQREIVAKIKETEQANTAQLQIHSPSQSPIGAEFSLYHYLTDEGKKVYPIILELYSSVRYKKEFAIMLHALNELDFLIDKHFTGQEQLHKALESTFKNVGRRQNLIKYLNDYSKPSTSERQDIDRHKFRLLESIKETQ